MVGYSFNLKGLEQAIANMDTAIRKVNSESNRALSEGGEIVRSTIEANTPMGPGNHGVHASQNVLKSNVTTEGGSGYKRVRVGYGPDSYWYMYFVNDGTYSKGNPKGIAPRKIVEKSMEQSGGPAEDIITAIMAEVINSLGSGG